MESDENIELAVRRVLANEIELHRNFLQTQFKYLTWCISIIFAAGAIVFVFLFGRSLNETKDELIPAINDAVIQYGIDETFQNRLELLMTSAIQKTINADQAQILIKNSVAKEANQYIEKVSSIIQDDLSKTVSSKLKAIENLNVDELVQRLALPVGTVIALNRPECPSGWNNFEAPGRAIIGVGEGVGLSAHQFGEKGGSEKLSLSVENLPPHQHLISFGAQLPEAPYGQGKPRSVVGGAAVINHPQTLTSPVGDALPINNMQPYIALRFCEKT